MKMKNWKLQKLIMKICDMWEWDCYMQIFDVNGYVIILLGIMIWLNFCYHICECLCYTIIVMVYNILWYCLYTDYRCECLSEYTGSTCEDDYDECLLQSPCRNGGFCVNNFGSEWYKFEQP